MKARRVVILLYNVGRDAFSLSELLDRQEQYLTYYSQVNKTDHDKPLVLISGYESNSILESDIYEIYSLTRRHLNFFTYLFFAVKRLRSYSSSSGFYIVAGTVLQPLIIGSLLKKFFHNSRLQVSVHGDLGAWRNKSVTNRLKELYVRLFGRNADLVRLVTAAQVEVAQRLFQHTSTEFCVCPIPIKHNLIVEGIRPRNEARIGVVGRLHPERGVDQWIQISRQLLEYELEVVGDGPLKERVIKELPNANVIGRVEHSEVFARYPRFSVLLSAAPFESYGLSIREALLSGTPVVTRKTLGVAELLNQFPRIIKGFDTTDEAVKAIQELSKGYDKDSFLEFREWFFKKQDEELRGLVKHWK
jgi:glycosyltransferase involved in cell wall biosynthesis